MKHKFLAIAQAVLIALVILSGAIALPILCRPFFYLHINAYSLPEAVGLTAQEVRTAYNEMMDFCTGLSGSFSAGVLPFSAEGAAHFADVRKLFILDLAVLAAALVLLTPLLVFGRRKNRQPKHILKLRKTVIPSQCSHWRGNPQLRKEIATPACGLVRNDRYHISLRVGGHTPGFWASVGLGVSFLVIGGLAALDFDRAFVIFHQLFFPGKDNWIFDYRTDPIIAMLPEAFFRNCALLILAVILICCGTLIFRDIYLRRKKKN